MENQKVRNIGIIMNGVTGRMGTRQHLERSILAIRQQGGLKTKSGMVIMPDPILLGRNEEKLKALADSYALKRYSTDIDGCLADPYNEIYFDAQTTSLRAKSVLKAVAAGKAIYSEKPVASNLAEALNLCRAIKAAGMKNGVVQDKLWLPGLLKLKHLIDSDVLGQILSVRGEFGYWVFDGKGQPCQRPSWNYRGEDGGGIIADMLCHWRYIVDNMFAPVRSVSCLGATHVGSRIDEVGKEYRCTAEDAAYATFLCDKGIVCHFNSSWAVRVRRDDLLTLQVDGTNGTAIAGLQKCFFQGAGATPTCVWDPDSENPANYFEGWQEVQPNQKFENAFRIEWEFFLKHVIDNEPFPWTFVEGAKGIQLADLALKSWAERKWVDLSDLNV
ncbi:MAG: Gfo/Idh/MocA family oxidoreductase [Ignavibacteriales bacterium]|nr:Gfo/Idh/MocA family oxidoreductase [Ignavibacteriales bacterium]